MNCAEYKELLVAYVEGLLDEEEKRLVAEHLKSCASCRAELREVSNLRDRLVKNSKTLAQSDLEEVVLDRIIREQNVKLKTATKISTSLKIRRIIMKSKITRFAAAAAIIIITGIVLSQLGSGTLTFAQVIEPILNARTVVFDFIVGEDETGPVIHDIIKDSRIRRTISNMPNNIMIIDLDNAKMLTLDPIEKGAAYVDIQGPLQKASRNFLRLVRNIVTDLKNHPEWPVQELGEQEIDGRRAVGFLISEPNLKLTIWADSKKAQPIRIELEERQSFTILKNIEFDVQVDDSLVSMDVPAGYTLHEAELDLGNFNEQDFIETLRMWPELLLDGKFPDRLSAEDFMKQVPIIGEKIGELDISDEQKQQRGMQLGRGLIFFQFLSHQSEYHYAGKGAKLGDTEKAIFWYKPKDSETWRVIYGDLSVKDVAVEDLPK